MERTIIAEGKTTNEAIEKGLKELNVSKNMVDIKVLENEEKRSFFSILAPRVVKVKLTVKEVNKVHSDYVKKDVKEVVLSKVEQQKAKENVEIFLDQFLKKIQNNVDSHFSVSVSDIGLNVDLTGNNVGFLIGYRGETLYAFQSVLSAIAGKGIDNKVRVILDIQGYKDKRKKALEDLAEKLAKTVVKTKKSVTLEPMQAYERKIIHSKLQDNNFVETRSIGEDPRRKVVISLKKK